MWHFICLLFDTDAFHYCVYEDIMEQIKKCTGSLGSTNISICWDSNFDKNRNKTFYTQVDNGIETTTSITQTLNLKKMAGDFINNSIERHPSHKNVLLFYGHGNCWFYRHKDKVQSFYNLLSDCKYKIDLLILDSCYLSTLEMCYDFHDFADIIVATEYHHSKISKVSSQLFIDSNTISNPLDLGILASNIYIQKLNDWPYNDTVLDSCSDSCVLNMKDFLNLYTFLINMKINECTDDQFKKAKVCPKKNKFLLNYDIYNIMLSKYGESSDIFIQFKTLFYNVVKFYKQTIHFKNNKPWHNELYGLSWAPSPWDNINAWTYKQTNIFKNYNKFTI